MAVPSINTVDRLADVVADAVRESLNRIGNQPLQLDVQPPNQPALVQSPAVIARTSRPSTSTPYRRAAQLQSTSGDTETAVNRSSRRFPPPSMFRAGPSRKRRVSSPRIITYVRDIVCLPKHTKETDGIISIPRGASRTFLAENGLIGKIQFTSNMSADEVSNEICEVFAAPMGLTEDDTKSEKHFPFQYLQRTGSGSRSLCSPAVSSTFEWSGRQVATLAKSGGAIYVIACEDLPVFDDVKQEVLSEEAMTVSSEEGVGVSSEDEGGTVNAVVHLPDSDDSLPIAFPSCADHNLAEVDHSAPSPPHDRMSSQAGCGSASTEIDDVCDLDRLLSVFATTQKIMSIFKASGNDFKSSSNCILTGPTLASIVVMMRQRFNQQAYIKVSIDYVDAWQDTVTVYKSSSFDITKPLRVQLRGQPALDTGGVLTQLYSTVFRQFAQNKAVPLFDGPDGHLRPRCTAQTRSSGLFKVLGTMVSHSIFQTGVGFPYFSPLCYWYIVDGEERSIQHLSIEDIGADVASVVTTLRDAETNEEVQKLLAEQCTVDILDRCGIHSVVNVSTSVFVAQEILTFEGLTKLLDQFCEGLKSLGLLKLIRAFPEEFASLLMYTGIQPSDIIDALSVHPDTVLQAGDHIVLSFLQQFIQESEEDELKLLLCHITGTSVAKKITVDFWDDVDAISAHTCSNTIVFPRDCFESYEEFKRAMNAIISSDDLLFSMS